MANCTSKPTTSAGSWPASSDVGQELPLRYISYFCNFKKAKTPRHCLFPAVIASVTSFWLIGRHFGTYTDPAQQVSGAMFNEVSPAAVWEIPNDHSTRTFLMRSRQRYLVRILLMVPIYAIYSWFSYFWCVHTVPAKQTTLWSKS